jgi:hypothetical protein
VPLTALLQRSAPRPSVPSLACLAAAALRRQLSCQLAELEEQLAEARNNTAVAVAADGGARDGSAHGGTAALLARLSGGSPHGAGAWLGAGGRGGAEAAAAAGCRASSLSGGRRGRHSRHASDSGICCTQHAWQPPQVGGSLRGGTAFEFDPLHAPPPLPELAQQLHQTCPPTVPPPVLEERSLDGAEQQPGSLRQASLCGFSASPGLQQAAEASPHCASVAAGVDRTATSITSVAGRPPETATRRLWRVLPCRMRCLQLSFLHWRRQREERGVPCRGQGQGGLWVPTCHI